MQSKRFVDLPVYCVIEIIEWLPITDQIRLMRINSEFKSIIKSQLNGRCHLTINSSFVIKCQNRYADQIFYSEADVYRIMRRDFDCNQIRALKVLEYVPNIISLNWSRLPFTAAIGDLLVNRCPKVKHLTVRECGHSAGLLNFVNKLRIQIETLRLKAVDETTSAYLVSICTNLKHLSTDHLLNGPLLIRIVGPKLKTLCLNRSEFNNDETFDAISESCHNLQTLKIVSQNFVSRANLTKLTNSIQDLLSISLTVASHDIELLVKFRKLKVIEINRYRKRLRSD